MGTKRKQIPYDPEIWREPYPWDEEKGAEVRRAMVKLGFYVSGSRNNNPAADYEVAFYRAALHKMADELSPDDLYVIYNAARVILLTKDTVDVYKLAAKRDQALYAWANPKARRNNAKQRF